MPCRAGVLCSGLRRGLIRSKPLDCFALPGGRSFASPKEPKCDLKETAFLLRISSFELAAVQIDLGTASGSPAGGVCGGVCLGVASA